jgi:hypothetical protein
VTKDDFALIVIAGLDPAMRLNDQTQLSMDARVKPAHDEPGITLGMT